ncbi:MAG: DUF3089 domain-containing protein [Bacteroidota bacterium]
MKYVLLFSFLCLSSTAIAQNGGRELPQMAFEAYIIPSAADYSDASSWAALPTTDDLADICPKGLSDHQNDAEVDIFFVHPTTYTGLDKHQNQWNANLADQLLNEKTDNSTIKYQATIFNKAGKIYAPRYRQAHIFSFFTPDTSSAMQALNLAYSDVETAFQYYLDHYNNGRPIVIASHSQGTVHAVRLVKEFFDGKPLQEKLVAAYLVGMPVEKTAFENIEPCETEEETNCFCSWRTFAQGYYPPAPWEETADDKYLVTNPLTWKTDTLMADYGLNKGGVLKKFNKVRKSVVDAQVHKGILWVNHPKVFGAKLANIKNFHVGDFNLFYVNVRENAVLRVSSFLENDQAGEASTD